MILLCPYKSPCISNVQSCTSVYAFIWAGFVLGCVKSNKFKFQSQFLKCHKKLYSVFQTLHDLYCNDWLFCMSHYMLLSCGQSPMVKTAIFHAVFFLFPVIISYFHVAYIFTYILYMHLNISFYIDYLNTMY